MTITEAIKSTTATYPYISRRGWFEHIRTHVSLMLEVTDSPLDRVTVERDCLKASLRRQRILYWALWAIHILIADLPYFLAWLKMRGIL